MNIKDKIQEKSLIRSGPMINAYPDSIGEKLEDIIRLLKTPELENTFDSFYILPSIYNTDLDRGFSVIDYELNENYASLEDLKELKKIGMALKLDIVLNHSSVLSKQFQDILNKGENSKYKDFFINWNEFWEGYGQMTGEGYIQPDAEYIKNMFFRKPGLPILDVRLPDGKKVPYWNTFYQEIKYEKVDAQDLIRNMDIQYTSAVMLAELINKSLEEGEKPSEIKLGKFVRYRENVIKLLESRRKYLGQMDLNIKSPLVWEFYEETLKKLFEYGAEIIRLDAFAYGSKEPGLKNFLNDPETWDILERIKVLANKYNQTLLPEIHSKYEDKTHEKLAQKGYIIYDFFLPGLIIDVLERTNNEYLIKWVTEIQEKKFKVVNMLGCHDGIPLLDLKGLIPDDQIENLIKTVVDRGGYVKDIHGEKNLYYQVNATYYSALGEDDRKLLLARAIQIFMPGKPQVWYLDLFAGKNDYSAVQKAGQGGHKEINRTNLTAEQIKNGLKKDIVLQQLYLLKFRNIFPAFGFGAELKILDSEPYMLKLCWKNNGCEALLIANLKNYNFTIKGIDNEGKTFYRFNSE